MSRHHLRKARCRRLLLLACLAGGLRITLFASGQDARDQQYALQEYPDLADPKSLLHQKFMELYGDAKANHPERLLGPSAYFLLAREAGSLLRQNTNHAALNSADSQDELVGLGFAVETLTIFLPYSATASGSPPEDLPAAELSRWQSDHGYRLTVRAHFFSEEEGRIPKEDEPKAGPPVTRLFARYASICAVKDFNGLGQLLDPPLKPEALETMTKDEITGALVAGVIKGLLASKPIQLRALVYLGKHLWVFYTTQSGDIKGQRIAKKGNELYFLSHVPEEFGAEEEFFSISLGKFLAEPGRVCADLVVRQ